MRSPVIFVLGFSGILGLFVGCSQVPQSPEVSAVSATATRAAHTQQNSLTIVVSVLPQKYFVEKIGGDRVKVSVMVGQGIEPENYEPKPQQLKDLSQADAYIGIGMLFENVWRDRLKSANQKMKWLDTAAGLKKLSDPEHFSAEITSQKHDHEMMDPHIWLSPKRVKQQAQQISQLLSQLDPQNEVIYAQNLGIFLTNVDQLDQQISQQLKPLKQRTFFIFHPSLGYFANDYNLKQVAIQEGGQEPSAAELTKLIQMAKTERIRVLFSQPQFSPQSVQAIAQEIGAKVVDIDPLAANWSENLLDITNALVMANSATP